MWILKVFLLIHVFGAIDSPAWMIDAYNIESRHYTSYRGERSSMFGFSVAEYRDRNKRGWVIVGAPKAQTNVKNVYRGGAVYSCNVAADNDCNQIPFDNQEHNQVNRKTPPYDLMQIDNKTLQWFGATVATSAQDGGPILACAPRYVFFGVAPGKSVVTHRDELAFGNQRDPVGTCFLTNLASTPREFSPCRTKSYGYHKQGSCQAGFAAAISKDGERIFVGAPGSWYWQGQMYSIPRSSDEFPFVPPRFKPYGEFAGQTFTQQSDSRGKVMFTKEAASWEDDRYLGYAVISGDFVGKGEAGTAVGVPRGDNLHGMVVLLSWNMTEVQNITGAQMGSYFGYALAAGDIDNDGLDDLMVGAPMYTVPDNPQMHFETGKVYIYYGKGPKKYTVFDERSGEANQGRFGMSLAYLGDIDHDGYGDFAVGAPYAGPDRRGAVYIYQGSPDGLLDKHSQVIYAEEMGSRVETFGFSIAGGLDLDGNLYPDMVVGSYESDSAMFFRSRPVIKMVTLDTYVQFGSSDKLVSLDDRLCVLSDGTRVTCLELKTCFKYTGDGVSSRYDFNVQYALDTKNTKSPRMSFLELEGRHAMNATISANRNEQYCRTVKVYVEPNIRDKLTSLDAEMRMSLEDESRIDDSPRNPLLLLRPILARTSSRKDSLSIRKNCGSDNICTPDLQLNCTSNVTEYLMGSNGRIVLEVKVVNANEDAYEAMFNLKIPPGIDYIKIDRIDQAEIPVQCSPVGQDQNRTLRCDIGNPLPKENLVHFNVILQPTAVDHEMSYYRFDMETNSSNPESENTTTHDNKKTIFIEIWVKTDLVIEGESRPKDVYYNPENYTSLNVTTEMEYGPGFTHNYTLQNGGPFTIEEAEIYLVWPAATLADDELVYLVEQPETSGAIVCASANSNPRSLKLERKNRVWQDRKTTNFGSIEENYYGTNDRDTNVRYPPVPPYNVPDLRINGETNGGGNVETGSSTKDRETSINDERGYSENSRSSNSSHVTITHGSNGEVTIVEDEWKRRGGIITTTNVATNTENRTSVAGGRQDEGNWENSRRQNEREMAERRRQEKFATERRRQEEEDEARRRQEEREEERRAQEERMIERRRQEQEANDRRRFNEHRTKEIVYGTEKHYGTTDEVIPHRIPNVGTLSTIGTRNDHAIIGDREENIDDSDFGVRLSNVTSSRELSNFLTALTRDSVGYEVFTENGGQCLRFLGRFRTSGDGKEYVEFKDGTTLPLENRDGGQSVSKKPSRTEIDRRFNSMEGRIVTSSDGRGYIQLGDGRRIALRGSYTYTEERTYTRRGGSGVTSSTNDRGTASLSGMSHEHRTIDENVDDDDYDDDYESSWNEETSKLEKDSKREYESHSSSAHEERRTLERERGSRIYQRKNNEKRSFRHERETRNVNDEIFVRKRETELPYDDLANHDFSTISRNEKFVIDSCKAAKCVSLRCNLKRLEKDQEIWISARYRVNAKTLRKVAAQDELKVSTQLIAKVTKLPTVGKPLKDVVKSHEIYTSMQPQAPAPAPDIVPLWIVVLSACAGVIILLLLIYLLHKCGFFKRNRPTDAPERQPLNRNGHFNGDDHL